MSGSESDVSLSGGLHGVTATEPTSEYVRFDSRPPLGSRIVALFWAWSGLFAKIGFSFLALLVSGVVAYRWIVYSYNCLTKALWEHAARLWALLDEISPSSTPRHREQKREKLREVIEEALDGAFETYSDWLPWKWLSLSELFMLLICVAIMVSAAYLFVRLTCNRAMRIVYRMRGVRFESVRAGSAFMPGKMPDCQVSIAAPGVLFDTHLGFGVRRGSYLVTPKHVISDMGAYMDEVILAGRKGKVLTSLVIEPSRIVEDLVYCYLSDAAWSMLGTASGKWSKDASMTYVNAYGLQGMTSGRLSKIAMRWMMAYTGTTVPGMSGTAYIDNGVVYGIHQGSAAHFNLGFSSTLVVTELSQLTKKESTADTNQDEYRTRFHNSENVWNQTTAIDDLVKRYEESDWTKPVDEDFYTRKLNFDDESAEKKKKAKFPVMTIPEGLELKIKNQNSEGVEQTHVALTERDYTMLRKIENLRIVDRLVEVERKVDSLEGWASALTAQPVEVQTESSSNEKIHFVCSLCGQKAKTQERLGRHMEASHQKVKPESAIHSDTGVSGKMVKTGPFLGKRNVSQNKSGTKSNNGSTSSIRSDQFRHREENLSGLVDSQKNIERSLSELLQVMRGLSLATMQK